MNESNNPGTGLPPSRLVRILKRMRGAAPFVTGVFAAFAGLLLYNLLFPGPAPISTRDVQDTVAQAMASATAPPAISSQVYQVIQPSLVLIQSKGAEVNGHPGQSLGSGVIVTDRGDVLTSLHVVKGAKDIELVFSDGTHSRAEILKDVPEQDIAVLHADQPPAVIIPAVLGDPKALNIGDEAYVVGNPFGLYGSMSAGVISGFDRSFEAEGTNQKLNGLIQIDSAVNPGNSGGPLLNRYGQVVGIVVGILNPTENEFFIGIGFAVPINIASSAAGSPLY